MGRMGEVTMTETRKERRDRKRAEGVQRRLAAALEDAWQRISEEKRAEFIGNGTDIRVDGRYLLASTNGEVWCMIDRLWLHSRGDELPVVETIGAVPDYVPEGFT